MLQTVRSRLDAKDLALKPFDDTYSTRHETVKLATSFLYLLRFSKYTCKPNFSIKKNCLEFRFWGAPNWQRVLHWLLTSRINFI